MIFTRESTLIILDWDDTLFPTSWISSNKINIKDDEIMLKYRNYFNDVDVNLSGLLEKMLSYGNIVIITNALLQWIYMSVSILPRTSYFINNKKVKLVSARADFANINSDPYSWKRLAFEREYNIYNSKKPLNNIMSIGDAEYEYLALINLFNKKDDQILKSVKFIKYPSRDLLLDQINVLNNAIDQICVTHNYLDLKFIE
jgi:hypothetical protein